MDALLADFKAQLTETRAKLQDPADLATLDAVSANLAGYEAAFQQYVLQEERKTQADMDMVKAANTVLEIVAQMQASQKEKLEAKVDAMPSP
jgi:hypothetical protein